MFADDVPKPNPAVAVEPLPNVGAVLVVVLAGADVVDPNPKEGVELVDAGACVVVAGVPEKLNPPALPAEEAVKVGVLVAVVRVIVALGWLLGFVTVTDGLPNVGILEGGFDAAFDAIGVAVVLPNPLEKPT